MLRDQFLFLCVVKGMRFLTRRRVLIIDGDSRKLEELSFETEIVLSQAIVVLGYFHHDFDCGGIDLIR